MPNISLKCKSHWIVKWVHRDKEYKHKDVAGDGLKNAVPHLKTWHSHLLSDPGKSLLHVSNTMPCIISPLFKSNSLNMSMVSSSKIVHQFFAFLPLFPFAPSYKQVSNNASWWVFHSIKNFPIKVYPGTFVCDKTTYHLHKNQGWLEKGSIEKEDGCLWCLLEMLLPITGTSHPPSQFLTPVSAKGERGMGLAGTTLLLGEGKPSMLQATRKYSSSSAWGNLDFPLASISPPAFLPAWLFSSYD